MHPALKHLFWFPITVYTVLSLAFASLYQQRICPPNLSHCLINLQLHDGTEGHYRCRWVSFVKNHFLHTQEGKAGQGWDLHRLSLFHWLPGSKCQKKTLALIIEQRAVPVRWLLCFTGCVHQFSNHLMLAKINCDNESKWSSGKRLEQTEVKNDMTFRGQFWDQTNEF